MRQLDKMRLQCRRHPVAALRQRNPPPKLRPHVPYFSWEQRLGLLAILLFTSKGGAGVSGSAIAVLTLTLAATKTIPVSSIPLILGIHRVVSAAFVFTNIAGNCVATLVVGKWTAPLTTRS